jgi:para-aminobenzoate synthetase/4-amino-4-deoxychorismate lyase
MATNDFNIYETLSFRIEDKEFDYLEEHLDRMRGTAVFFDRDFDEDRVRKQIALWISDVDPQTDARAADGRIAPALRVRFYLDPCGRFVIESEPMFPIAQPVRAAFAKERTRSTNILRQHKTSRREAYDAALKRAIPLGYWDVIFRNERGEITEGARTNVFLKTADGWLTPPLDCGLLPGVLRRVFERVVGEPLVERVLTADDLRTGKIYVGSSVRGLLETVMDFDVEI